MKTEYEDKKTDRQENENNYFFQIAIEQGQTVHRREVIDN